MKFAEELDDSLIPEWRDKYLKYKTGKRLVKAIQRAINRTNGVVNPRDYLLSPLAFHGRDKSKNERSQYAEEITPLRADATMIGEDLGIEESYKPGATHGENEAKSPRQMSFEETRASDVLLSRTSPRATHDQEAAPERDGDSNLGQAILSNRDHARRSLAPLDIPSKPGGLNSRGLLSSVAHDRATETPKPGGLRRFPTGFDFARIATQMVEIKLHPIDLMDLRKREFFTFLDGELEKIETFYQSKEAEAGQRLDILKAQLHMMRDRRNEELAAGRKLSLKSWSEEKDNGGIDDQRRTSVKSRFIREHSKLKTLQVESLTPVVREASRSRPDLEYVRKPSTDDHVSYRSAKHKLRIAVQEFYRSLELLRSYALLNRTAFRKLNKKYDKTVNPNGRPTLDWFHEKISESRFTNSNLIDGYIESLEDLSARYLEGGNRKLAAEKLRQLTQPKGDRSGSALLNGLMVGIGLTFGIEGIYLGIHALSEEDDDRRAQVPFLLQLYAGYFFMLYMFSWFCFNCRTWSQYKVNYPFIFEFDPRHHLDWRQLSNFPCFFTLVLGVFMWLNFSNLGDEVLFVWYPVMLIGFTVLVILIPLPILRWRSRKWFVVAHWRLLLSGIYPVEFRDFILGDLYCSLAYSIANAELFFCLYARQWNEPIRCSSRFSWLVGFASTIPFIWRSFQCIRRFWDSKQVFPHLANLLKYMLAIAAAVTLSLFRLNDESLELSLFIAFASISAFYSALWDVFMDFSLIQGGPYPGLREVMAFNQPWLYYGILVIDPVLRFSFVLSIIFTHSIQHGSYVAFVIAFVEVTRRGMWMLFRVENEHCTNIKLQKASRDIPLPYSILSTEQSNAGSSFALLSMRSESRAEQLATPLMESGLPVETPKQRGNLFRSITRRLGAAHRQDFQKGRCAPTVEDLQEPRGIEQALIDDEGSDDEAEGTSRLETMSEEGMPRSRSSSERFADD